MDWFALPDLAGSFRSAIMVLKITYTGSDLCWYRYFVFADVFIKSLWTLTHFCFFSGGIKWEHWPEMG